MKAILTAKLPQAHIDESCTAARRCARFGVSLTLCFLVCLCGCSTMRRVKMQKLALLSSEVNYLDSTRSLLVATPNPEIQSMASVFISQGAINQILAGADNYSTPIPSIKNTELKIESIRTALADGFPTLTVKASARRSDWNLTVDLNVSAMIEPQVVPNDPSKLAFKVNVTEVVPVAHWGIFQIRLWYFVRELLQLKLQEYIDKFPTFTVPLQQQLAFTQAPSSQTTRWNTHDGFVEGAVAIPGVSYMGTLKIDRVLFLRDGIRVFLSVTR